MPESLERPAGASFFIVASFQEETSLFEAKVTLEKKFSKVLYESPLLIRYSPDESESMFVFPGRWTKILSFKQRIHREELVERKKDCIELQSFFQKRDPSFYLIPGYITSYNVIIAKSKEDLHRTYLFQGVFAETVYEFVGGKFKPRDTAVAYFHNNDINYYFQTLRESYEVHKHKS